MSIELIIAILLFFGVATNDEIKEYSETETKTLYEQQELDDAAFIDQWNDDET